MNSIYHLIEKIKGFSNTHKRPILHIIVIFVVAIGSFYLGKISNSIQYNENTHIVNKYTGDKFSGSVSNTKFENRPINSGTGKQGNYVASKNGKLYYRIGCGSSSRIKEENKVFFTSASDAENAGFQASSSCTP